MNLLYGNFTTIASHTKHLYANAYRWYAFASYTKLQITCPFVIARKGALSRINRRSLDVLYTLQGINGFLC